VIIFLATVASVLFGGVAGYLFATFRTDWLLARMNPDELQALARRVAARRHPDLTVMQPASPQTPAQRPQRPQREITIINPPQVQDSPRKGMF
jgi:hypothetical protein